MRSAPVSQHGPLQALCILGSRLGSGVAVKLGRDRFRVRERLRPLMLSYLGNYLLRMVRMRPHASAGIRGDRYSLGYSPLNRALPGHLDANYLRPLAGQKLRQLTASVRVHRRAL
jgi:hypothetical protein